MDAERRLRRLVDLIGPVLLPGWTIAVHIQDALPFQPKDAARGYGKVGICDAKWQYTRADLHVGMSVFEKLERREQAEWIVHELFHAVVNEMRVRGIAHEERVVSNLTAGLMRALQTPALRKEMADRG
jgi:hypothetical protein